MGLFCHLCVFFPSECLHKIQLSKGPFTPSDRVSFRQHCNDDCDTVSLTTMETLENRGCNSIVVNENCVTSLIAAVTQTESDAWCERALSYVPSYFANTACTSA